eukprot:364951-Chlamydomonas_euryale.AAC.8
MADAPTLPAGAARAGGCALGLGLTQYDGRVTAGARAAAAATACLYAASVEKPSLWWHRVWEATAASSASACASSAAAYAAGDGDPSTLHFFLPFLPFALPLSPSLSSFLFHFPFPPSLFPFPSLLFFSPSLFPFPTSFSPL